MREDKNENRWEKLLQIHTMGRERIVIFTTAEQGDF